MLDPAAFVAEVASSFSAVFGGPYFTGSVISQADTEYDAGGDVVPGSGGSEIRSCDIQIDTADTAMRQAKDYTEGQMRCLILVATLEGALDTDAVVSIGGGPFAGTTWQVSGIAKDAMGTHWTGKAIEA